MMTCTLAVAIVTLAACAGSSTFGGGINPQPSPSPAQPTAPPAPTPTPVLLAGGQLVGTPTFPVGDTATGGQGSPIDGLSCGVPNQTFHIHSHLSIFHNGMHIADAVAIGIPGAVITTMNGGPYTNQGTCFYPLHTHDSSGIIHIEAAAPTSFTLGEVFDIWGEPLSARHIAGFSGPMLIYVDANEHPIQATIYAGDPRAIVLTNHQQITIEVGAPYVYPTFYTWGY
jgi:hypothetical protein